IEKGKVKSRLEQAINELYKRDFDLIKIEAEEEAVTAQLICYLKPLFDSWSVDVEYNRDGRETKNDSAGKQIYPDIIIHHRTPDRVERFSPENNFIAIEVKGHWNAADRGIDEIKLRNIKNRYGYQYLFRIELDSDKGRLIEVT